MRTVYIVIKELDFIGLYPTKPLADHVAEQACGEVYEALTKGELINNRFGSR